MNIKIIKKYSFGDRGREFLIFENHEMREAYFELTGHKVITAKNLDLLYKLFGVEFDIE